MSRADAAWPSAATLLAIIALGFSWQGSAVMGFPVTWEFAGEVTGLHDPNSIFGGAVSVGDAFSGTYTFESTTPDTNDDLTFGRYTDAITGIDGQISGFNFFGPVDTSPDNPANSILVSDDFDQLADTFGVRAGVDFFDHPFRFDLTFILGSRDILENDSLLLEPPAFEVFTVADFRLVSELPGVGVTLNGQIQSLVPEPTSMALLAIGAIKILRRPRRPSSTPYSNMETA